jgi:hypothetical protein
MSQFLHWAADILPPGEVMANLVPFTRSGGRSLGGIERTTRTDRGYWQITLDQIPVHSPAQRRVWNALRTGLGGRAGLIAVPVWSFFSAPYASGHYEEGSTALHDDGAPFSDGSTYAQGAIDVQMASYAPIGATVVSIRLGNATSASGIRFSYRHALYETGPVIGEVGQNVFQVPVFPAIRMPVPADAQLELDEPTCLCHLQEDRGMDQQEGISILQRRSVTFVEAVDYWNDLALGEVA